MGALLTMADMGKSFAVMSYGDLAARCELCLSPAVWEPCMWYGAASKHCLSVAALGTTQSISLDLPSLI